MSSHVNPAALALEPTRATVTLADATLLDVVPSLALASQVHDSLPSTTLPGTVLVVAVLLAPV